MEDLLAGQLPNVLSELCGGLKSDVPCLYDFWPAPPPGACARARRTGNASPQPPGRCAAQGHPIRPLSAAMSRTRLKKAALLGMRHFRLRGTWQRAADAGAHARTRKDDSSQEERQARQTTTRQSTDSRLMTTVSPSPSWPFQALRPSSISTLLWPFGTKANRSFA